MTERIIVVGGSHAAAQLAMSLTEERPGSDLVILSDDAHLPYHRPPLSKAFLKDETNNVQLIRAPELYEARGVEVRLNTRVSGIDPAAHRLETQQGETLAYDKLVLATGAQVRRLACEGADANGIHYLRSAGDAQRLRPALHAAERVVVIGGGFIGLEAAATANALGKKTTVLEMAPQLMGRAVTPDFAQFVQAHHQSVGLDVRTGTGLSHFEIKDGSVCAAVTMQGETIKADLVIAGIGVTPAMELAEEAGLRCGNGIEVDGGLLTSDAHIYAMGDCVSFLHRDTGERLRLESIQNANDQAKAVARALCGEDITYQALPWFWSDQGDLKLQMVGLWADADRTVQLGTPEEGGFSLLHFRENRLICADSVNKPGDHMAVRRILDMELEIDPADVAAPGFSLRAAAKGR